MKRKFKLISSIASVSLAVAFLVFGVFAAAQKTVGIHGTVGFVAVNLDADVEVSYTLPGAEEAVSFTKIEFRLADTEDNSVNLEIPAASFDEFNRTLEIVVKITNKSAKDGITVTAPTTEQIKMSTGTWEKQDIDITSENPNANFAMTALDQYIEYTITYTLNPASNEFEDATYGFGFLLERMMGEY